MRYASAHSLYSSRAPTFASHSSPSRGETSTRSNPTTVRFVFRSIYRLLRRASRVFFTAMVIAADKTARLVENSAS